MKVYWNGSYTNEKEVSISPWDLGFLRGYGVFDYLVVYNSRPFMLEEHYNRLVNSARAIELEVPITKEEFVTIVNYLIKENKIIDSAIRTILTGGVSSNGISKTSTPTFIIRPELLFPPKPDIYETGAKLITVDYEREIPHAKTTHYIEALRNESRLKNSQAIEMLFTSRGNIFECSRGNIFIVTKGAVVTPAENILPGITRRVVLEEATALGINTEERVVSLEEALSAKEVFISTSGKGVVPIISIDKNKIGSGTPGMITDKIRRAYEARAKK